MSRDFEDNLSAEERRALDGLAREKAPPPFLEERVVETLKQSKLLRPSESARRWRAPGLGLAVAASLLFFVLGALAGARWASGPGASGPEFMLMLRSAPGQGQSGSGEGATQRVREYSNWAGQLRRQGVRVDGEELGSEARILRAKDGRAVVSESGSDPGPDAVAGYFVIGARDYEHAVKIAEGCPHLKYGGTVEVRRIGRF